MGSTLVNPNLHIFPFMGGGGGLSHFGLHTYTRKTDGISHALL